MATSRSGVRAAGWALGRALGPQRWAGCVRRYSSAPPEDVVVLGTAHKRDEWTNVGPAILGCTGRQLHLQPAHPIGIIKGLIESQFARSEYTPFSDLSPVVSTYQNFDSLNFPADHPGRSRTDTYYVNASTVLRTHTSAHQVEKFQASPTDGYLITADVYRRDAIDRSHYPAFHQMEGARTWARGPDVVERIRADMARIPNSGIVTEDPNPPFEASRNPKQPGHSDAEVVAVGEHLKRTLEMVVGEVFAQAKRAAVAAGTVTAAEADKPLQVRWIEAYFPFTSPSWEMEVFWNGDWLELFGCGVVRQEVLDNAGMADRLGWAFGLGLDRLAMILFGVPDIRLFWTTDERFLGQFTPGTVSTFRPYSKYPGTYRDTAFWLDSPDAVHENDVMEIVRGIAGDLVEDVRQIDEFTHPKTGKKSVCYRINYQSMERSLTNDEVNVMHEAIRAEIGRLPVTLR
ncbi:phenylalanine--tRNA ligase [Dipodascopsis tothii]|uniref:phenylalanine--tRNA ligase n=1 Tax=Dipodascopsis tothii TaxID=44089 RepID=UPI0034CF0803